jgi:hypothetical protein
MAECNIPYLHNLQEIEKGLYSGFPLGVPQTIEEILNLLDQTSNILRLNTDNKYSIKDVRGVEYTLPNRVSDIAKKDYKKHKGVDKLDQDDAKKQTQLGSALHAVGHAAGLLYSAEKAKPENRNMSKGVAGYEDMMRNIANTIYSYYTNKVAIPEELTNAIKEMQRYMNKGGVDPELFELTFGAGIITNMVKTAARQIDEAYVIQNSIDDTKHPIFKFEQKLLDLSTDKLEGGTGDIIVIFSDKTGGYLDYKTYEPDSYSKERVYYDDGKKWRWVVTKSNSHGAYRSSKWKETVTEYERILKEKYGITDIRMSRIVPVATFWSTAKDIQAIYANKGLKESYRNELAHQIYLSGKGRGNTVLGIESMASSDLEETSRTDYPKKMLDIVINKEKISDTVLAEFVATKERQLLDFEAARSKAKTDEDRELYKNKIASLNHMINSVTLLNSLEPTMEYLNELMNEIEGFLRLSETGDQVSVHERIVHLTRYIDEIAYYEEFGPMLLQVAANANNLTKEKIGELQLIAGGFSNKVNLQIMQLKTELSKLAVNINSSLKTNTGNKQMIAFEAGGFLHEWFRGASNSNNVFINTMFEIVNKLTMKAEDKFKSFLTNSDKVFANLNKWMKENNWGQAEFENFFIRNEEGKVVTGNLKNIFNKSAFEIINEMDEKGGEEALKFFTTNFKIKEGWEENYQKRLNKLLDLKLREYNLYNKELDTTDKRTARAIKDIQNDLTRFNRYNNFYLSSVELLQDKATGVISVEVVEEGKRKANVQAWTSATNRKINTEWTDTFKENHYNDMYKFMRNNPPLLEWYNHWIDNMVEARNIFNIYDSSVLPRNFIPNTAADGIDMIRSSGITSGVANSASLAYTHLQMNNEDVAEIHDGNGNLVKNIPIPFLRKFKVKKIVDGKEVYETNNEMKSFDMQFILTEFMRSAYSFEQKQAEEPVLMAIRNVMEDRGRNYVYDSKGNLVTEPDGTPKLKELGEEELNNFDKYMDVYIYGKSVTSKDTSIGGVSMNKAAMAAMKVYADKVLKYNIWAPMAAYFAGNINTWLTGVKGNVFNKQDYYNGIKRKGSHIGTSFSEATEEGKKAKMFLHRFDPYMRSEYANAGSQRTNKGLIRQFFSDRAAYYLFQKVDDLLMDTVSFSMADSYLIDENGKLRHRSMIKPAELKSGVYKSLWDSFVIDETADSVGVKIIGVEGKELTKDQVDDIIIAFKNATRETQRGIMGSQSEQDISMYSTHLLGKMIGQFKNWIPNLVNEMGKGLEYNKNTDIVDIGRFTAVGQVIGQGSGDTLTQSALQLGKIAAFIAVDLIPYLNLLNKANDANETKAKAWFENWKRNHPQLSKDVDGNEITFEQYNDAKKAQLRVFTYQVRVLAVMALITMLATGDWDDDGEPDYRQNYATRWLFRVVNRTWREAASMYSYSDFNNIIGGGAIPMWGLTRDIANLFGNMYDESKDLVVGENSSRDQSPIGFYAIGWVPLLARIRQIFELSDKDFKAVR